MTHDILHPDRLGPGDPVGPWRILEVIGAGGFGRVFKVERDGKVYALKMAVRLPGEKLPGEEDVDGWCLREATGLMGRTPHPNIPSIFAVGRWPDAEAGYLFVVMEHIDGWSFHDWRYETHPSAAQLLDVMLPLVHTVAGLHTSGVHHRDLSASNVIIRKENGSPALLDFGSVSLPGARTLTQGLPPVNLSVAPPEAFEHLHLNSEGARFRGGAAADLYALGVLMYQALTDGYPFNPELPPERLLIAITLRTPRAPHRMNPKVPLSLSRITMRLLSKRPEDRYESAEALYQALWDANKERASPEWRVPLDLPESGPALMSDEELHERKLEEERIQRAVRADDEGGDAAPPVGLADGALESEVVAVAAPRPQVIDTRDRVRLPVATLLGCALVVGLVALAVFWQRSPSPPTARAHQSAPPTTVVARQEVAPPWKWPDSDAVAASTPAAAALPAMLPEESVSVKTLTLQSSTPRRTARKVLGAAMTCSMLVGCPGAQVRPKPPAEECPEGAVETMAKWNIKPGDHHTAVFVTRGNPRVIPVREGRMTVYVIGGNFEGMPGATMLSGRLYIADRIYGRLTQAQTPEGDVFPVCFELYDIEGGRGVIREPGDGAETAGVFSTVDVNAVRSFE